MRIGERRHGLRHSAHDEILPENIHDGFMQVASKRPPLREMLSDNRHRHRTPRRPHELLYIHWKHLKMPFLGGYHDVLDVLLNGNERPGLNIVIASVGDQILNRLPRPRESLHFVKYDNALPLGQLHIVGAQEIHEKRVKVLKILIEIALDLGGNLGKVNQEVRFVFIAGEFLGNPALADATRAIEHNGRFAIAHALPFKQLVVNLAFHILISLENASIISSSST